MHACELPALLELHLIHRQHDSKPAASKSSTCRRSASRAGLFPLASGDAVDRRGLGRSLDCKLPDAAVTGSQRSRRTRSARDSDYSASVFRSLPKPHIKSFWTFSSACIMSSRSIYRCRYIRKIKGKKIRGKNRSFQRLQAPHNTTHAAWRARAACG